MSDTKIVTVWLDETSDAGECRWIVDTDAVSGGDSETVRTFPGDEDGEKAARRFAAEYAAANGMASVGSVIARHEERPGEGTGWYVYVGGKDAGGPFETEADALESW
jgi:hypothetical protein